MLREKVVGGGGFLRDAYWECLYGVVGGKWMRLLQYFQCATGIVCEDLL